LGARSAVASVPGSGFQRANLLNQRGLGCQASLLHVAHLLLDPLQRVVQRLDQKRDRLVPLGQVTLRTLVMLGEHLVREIEKLLVVRCECLRRQRAEADRQLLLHLVDALALFCMIALLAGQLGLDATDRAGQLGDFADAVAQLLIEHVRALRLCLERCPSFNLCLQLGVQLSQGALVDAELATHARARAAGRCDPANDATNAGCGHREDQLCD